MRSGRRPTSCRTATIRSGCSARSRRSHPEIEHLGNWHTHHVNGLTTLSGGDKATYFKTVNHEKHNTDFFYALLVVSKNRGGNPRYAVKHFIFRRGDETIYEIPASEVRLVDSPPLRPRGRIAEPPRSAPPQHGQPSAPNPERAKDQEFFAEFYPGLKPLLAKDIGAPYWKGPLTLVDGSRAEVVAMEDPDDTARSYSIATSSKNPAIADILDAVQGTQIPLGAARRPASRTRPQSGALSRQEGVGVMNIITVNVGQGALAIVRHQKEAIIVDCRIPPSDDARWPTSRR